MLMTKVESLESKVAQKDKEKQATIESISGDEIFKLDVVGEVILKVKRSTLISVPDSILESKFSGRFEVEK